MQLILNWNKIQTGMVQEKAKHFIVDPAKCMHCQERKKQAEKWEHVNARDLLCKKHASIYDWSMSSKRCGKFVYKNKTFWLFGNYAVMDMPSDENGLFVIWFSPPDQNRYATFSIHKKYFGKLEECGIDITKDIEDSQYILYNGVWILSLQDDKPFIEKVK